MEVNQDEHMLEGFFREDDYSPNIVHILNNQQLGLRKKSATQLKQFGDWKTSVSGLEETRYDLFSSYVSVSLMAFSPDCTQVALSHSDSSIFVFDVKTGRFIRRLESHRAPLDALIYHPMSNDIIASGCKFGHVRIWRNLNEQSSTGRYPHSITSLAFHPTRDILAICSGNMIYFWKYNSQDPGKYCSTKSERELVQYVKFDPLGDRMITGIFNLNDVIKGHCVCNRHVMCTGIFLQRSNRVIQDCRIQVWDYSTEEIPVISNATENVVVSSCVIQNDASVDISKDGEMVVVLIPHFYSDVSKKFTFGIFSLKPGHLGRILYICDFVTTALSVSFSPFAQYVVVGLKYSNCFYSNFGKSLVVHIMKLNKTRETYTARCVRSFAQFNNGANYPEYPSHVNFVHWLPISGHGIAYATQNGSFSICKPAKTTEKWHLGFQCGAFPIKLWHSLSPCFYDKTNLHLGTLLGLNRFLGVTVDHPVDCANVNAPAPFSSAGGFVSFPLYLTKQALAFKTSFPGGMIKVSLP